MRSESYSGSPGLRRQDHPAGVAVEAVDDPRAQFPVSRRQGAGVAEECVDECAALVALGGVDHHVGRLVYGDEGLVLVEDVERYVLGGVAASDLVTGLHLAVVDQDPGLADEFLDEGAGEIWERGGQILVNAAAGHAAANGK